MEGDGGVTEEEGVERIRLISNGGRTGSDRLISDEIGSKSGTVGGESEPVDEDEEAEEQTEEERVCIGSSPNESTHWFLIARSAGCDTKS